MNKYFYYLTHPAHVLYKLAGMGIVPMDDKKYLKRQFKEHMGYEMDFSNPRTFDEKLNWLKLYDRNPLYTKMVDKYEAKLIVAEKLGDKYIIPTLGIYDSFDEIDFTSLPNQFVIKCTHDSGGVFIVKDKNNMDVNTLRKTIEKLLSKNFFYFHREWPYKNVNPRIIIEKYMEDDNTKELRDYKFYCFNGNVKAMLLASNRQKGNEELRFDYYDKNFVKLNMTNYWHPNAIEESNKPKSFNEMIKFASELSVGFPHVRIDFYEVNGQVFFGEFTFYDQAGYLKINPKLWEIEWGDLIDLNLAYNIKTKNNRG